MQLCVPLTGEGATGVHLISRRRALPHQDGAGGLEESHHSIGTFPLHPANYIINSLWGGGCQELFLG